MIPKKVLVIGGTGAMGSFIVRKLLTSANYLVHIFTRDPENARIREFQSAHPNRVVGVKGDLDQEQSLLAAMQGVDAVFCNTDFWSTASALKEYEQGLRALSAAQKAGIQHFIWSSLDNVVGLTDGAIAVPHFDSKAAVESWINLMRSEEFMRKETDGWFSRHVSVLVTAPYFENLQFRAAPKAGKLSDGRDGFIFNLPLGPAPYPLIGLDDIAWFTKLLLDHPVDWVGKTLRVVGEGVTGDQIAATFESMTGLPAEYRNVPLEAIRTAMPDTGHDVAAMAEYFQKYDVMGRARDLGALRKLHPDLMTFKSWLAKTGWRGEPVEVQKKAVQISSSRVS